MSDMRNPQSSSDPDNDPTQSEVDDTLVDMAAVRRDDELLDALGADGLVPTDSEADYQLATLLAHWRDDVLAGEMPASPTVDEAHSAVMAEKDTIKRRKSMRHLRIAAASVAVGAVILGGVTAVARQAQPGDPLWDVRDLMFGEQTTTTSVYSALSDDLRRAEQALDQGNTGAALAYIQEAKNGLPRVEKATERAELEAWINRLMDRIHQSGNGSASLTTSAETSTSEADGSSSAAAKPTKPITTTQAPKDSRSTPPPPPTPGQPAESSESDPGNSALVPPDVVKEKPSTTSTPSTPTTTGQR